MTFAAQAGTINVMLSDVDVTYLGSADDGAGAIFDALGGYAGGNLDANQADSVKTAVFENNGAVVGTLMNDTGDADNMYADLRIDAMGASLPVGSFLTGRGNNGGGFGFDWFTASGHNLRLGITSVDMLLTNNVMFFTGTATVLSQNLPFGLPGFVPNNIAFAYTATRPGIDGNGGGTTTTGAMGSGQLSISGEAIPEPGTIGLFCTGIAILVIGLACGRSRWAARTLR
jgi:hypothetical protein